MSNAEELITNARKEVQRDAFNVLTKDHMLPMEIMCWLWCNKGKYASDVAEHFNIEMPLAVDICNYMLRLGILQFSE